MQSRCKSISAHPLSRKLKKSLSQTKNINRNMLRLVARLSLGVGLALFILTLISFYSTSSAQQRNIALIPKLTGASPIFSFPQAVIPEAIETFEADCATPENVYILGETVCAVATSAPPPLFGFRQRRFQWVAPNGTVVQQTEITTDPQSNSYTIPTTGPEAQVGTWSVRTINNRGSIATIAHFTVSDPNNLRADLSVGKVGPLEVKSGNNVSYSITLINRGPDDAQNVELTDAVPTNMTFVAGTQTSGASFNCTHPSSGGTGTSVCTIATLPRNSTAAFTFIYQVDSGTATGTTIENTVNVSSSTVELNPADNSFTAPVTVTGAGSGGDDCVVSCPADITVPHEPGVAGATVTYPAPTTTGSNCGAVSSVPASGTFFPVGTTTVIVSAETGEPCSFNVTVEDTVAPTISCPSDITVAEDAGTPGSAIVTYTTPTATDDTNSVTVSCDRPSGSSFPVGTTTVTCTATDAAINQTSCSFTVTVTGTSCELSCPSNLVVDAPSGACGAIVNYPAPTATACGTVTSTPASGTFFNVGTTTVTVTTSSGASCEFTVTVLEHTPPVVVAPAPTSANVDASCQAFVPDYLSNLSASDNCTEDDFLIKSQNPAAGTPVGPGVTNVSISVSDSSNNTTTVNTTFTVNDVTPPVLTVNGPNSITVECHTSFTDPGATATDDCVANPPVTTSSNVNVNVPGNYTITYTTTDGTNTVTATRNVTVVDTTAPVITLNGSNPMTVECHTSFTDPGATANDLCAGSVPVTSTNNVNVNVPGSYTVTYTATDGTNTATATRTVNVVDTTAPTLTCPSDLLVEFNPAAGGAVVTYTPPVGSDTCAGTLTATQLTGLPSGATFPLGTTTNTFQVTDGAGLTATCSFKVTVALTSIIGLDSVTLSGVGIVDSYDSNGSYPATKSSLANVLSNGTITMLGSAKVWGNVRSTRAGVNMSGATQVTGNATAGTTVSRSGSATVGGTITNNALAPVMVMPAVSVCGPPYSSGAGISGTYSYNSSTGDLTLSGTNVATLANGNYCFRNVTVGSSSQLKVNGPVTIKLTGTMNTSGAASVNNTTLIPSNLRILSSYTGSNGVNFTNSASAYLIVYAPGTNVTISGAAPLFGTVVGKTLTVSNSGKLHYDVRLVNTWPSLWPLIVGP